MRLSAAQASGFVMRVRDGCVDDFAALLAMDEAAHDPDRAEEIRGWAGAGALIVAEEGEEGEGGGRIVGYAVLEHSFFGRGFLRMVGVAAGRRRQGIGRALVRAAEERARTARVFASTNASNAPMRALLTQLGYTECGEVRGLDEGDPEIFYFTDVR